MQGRAAGLFAPLEGGRGRQTRGKRNRCTAQCHLFIGHAHRVPCHWAGTEHLPEAAVITRPIQRMEGTEPMPKPRLFTWDHAVPAGNRGTEPIPMPGPTPPPGPLPPDPVPQPGPSPIPTRFSRFA